MLQIPRLNWTGVTASNFLPGRYQNDSDFCQVFEAFHINAYLSLALYKPGFAESKHWQEPWDRYSRGQD